MHTALISLLYSCQKCGVDFLTLDGNSKEHASILNDFVLTVHISLWIVDYQSYV